MRHFFLAILVVSLTRSGSANDLAIDVATFQRAVRVVNDDQLRKAITAAIPGDDIVLLPGVYRGGIGATLVGRPDGPIRLRAHLPDLPPIIRGGHEGLKLSSCHHLILQDLIFEGAAENGVNIDDGGRIGSPATHIQLTRVVIREAGRQGNQDGLKMSGVDHFLLQECRFEGCGAQGQQVDLVGCHQGKVVDCVFDGQDRAPLGFQAKGGSSDIVVENCRFFGIVERGLQIGGTTGKTLFRPAFDGVEARNVLVTRCCFSGIESPITFVNSDSSLVEESIFDSPTNWFIRILQESNGSEYPPCRQGTIRKNVFVWNSRELVAPINVGAGTAAETFRFSDNSWYCEDRPLRSHPSGMPSIEINGIYGVNPQLHRGPEGLIEALLPLNDRRAAYRVNQTWQNSFFALGGLILAGLVVASTAVHRRLKSRYSYWDMALPRDEPLPPVVRIQRFLGISTFGWLAILLLASWYPLEYASFDPEAAWTEYSSTPWGVDAYRRTDWIGLWLAAIPLGFLATGFVTVTCSNWLKCLWRCSLLLATLACAQFAIELGQSAFPHPNRVVSRNDTLAMFLGTAFGSLVWLCAGLPLARWHVERRGTTRPIQPIDVLAWTWITAVVFASWSPFDLILQPRDIYYKYNSGLVQVVPFLDGEIHWVPLLGTLLAFVPIGVLTAIAGTSAEKPARNPGLSLLASIAIVFVIELGQVFIRSRICSATQMTAGVVGAAIGILITHLFLVRSPVFSPKPVADYDLQRIRWAVHAALMGIVAACGIAFVKYWY